MGKIFADHSVSLDGFSAGPNVRMDNPMGDGGERLHEWQFRAGARPQVLEDLFGSTGAVVVGRRTFDLGEKPWGEDPPFHRPVFVVTNRPKATVAKKGGTTYTFVTDGLDGALTGQPNARADAADRCRGRNAPHAPRRGAGWMKTFTPNESGNWWLVSLDQMAAMLGYTESRDRCSFDPALMLLGQILAIS